MNINISSINFSADKKLKTFVETKVEGLTQVSDDILDAEIHLSLEKSQKKNFDSKVSKIKILVPGDEFFSEKRHKTFEGATDAAVSAIKTLLIKRKEKFRQK